MSGYSTVLWYFPLSGIRGAKNRLDYGHIVDSVRNRNRHVAVLAYGARKGVSLYRVLVTSVNNLGYDFAAEYVAVVNKNSTWPIIGSIEWYLDFNAAQCAQEMKSLIGNKLSAASKSGMPGREIEHRGNEPVHMHIWISRNEAHNA